VLAIHSGLASSARVDDGQRIWRCTLPCRENSLLARVYHWSWWPWRRAAQPQLAAGTLRPPRVPVSGILARPNMIHLHAPTHYSGRTSRTPTNRLGSGTRERATLDIRYAQVGSRSLFPNASREEVDLLRRHRNSLQFGCTSFGGAGTHDTRVIVTTP